MAEDRFTENFRCPNCGRVGTAKLSQEDGWAFLKGNTGTVIESLTDNFITKQNKASEYGFDIFCIACNTRAIKYFTAR